MTPDDTSSGDERLRQRVTEVETLLTHLQHDYHQLNEAVLSQQARFTTIERQLLAVEQKLRDVAERPSEPSDPLDEKPPHY